MRVWDFIVKEVRQAKRDRRLVFMVLAMPVIQLLLYGLAVTTDIRHLTTVICDLDHSSQSRAIITAVQSSHEYFDIVGYASTQDEAASYLQSGRASIVVVIPEKYSADISRGHTGTIQALVDGTDPNTGTIAAAYISKVVIAQATTILQQRATTAGLGDVTSAGVDGRVQFWYNPTLESSFFFVPGVMCMLVSNLTMILTAMALVREKEIGTMEQLLVTPIRPWELMLGKLIPYMALGFVDVIVIQSIATLLFGVPMRGSLALLLLVAGIFMAGTLGLGLLVSSLSQTQMQAGMLTAFVLMPNMMLSGFMFPIANMPAWLQPITYLFPMRYFLTCVRGIMLKGNGMADLAVEVIPLSILSLVIFASAVMMFRKRLD